MIDRQGPRMPAEVISDAPAAGAPPGTPSIEIRPPRLDHRRLGVLSGLGYRNQRGGLKKISRFMVGVPDVPHRIARTPDEVARVLDEFHAMGIGAVAVNGGDGTVSMVMTDILTRRRPGEYPHLAILAGGRTNMTAGDVGLPGDPIRRMRRLLAWRREEPASGDTITRPVISVETDTALKRSHGMFVGGASIYDASLATWRFRDTSHLPGMKTGLGTAVSVTILSLRRLLGQQVFDPTTARIRLDGVPLEPSEYLLFFVTTLDRMALGLTPFWGDAPAPMRFSAITHDCKRLALTLPEALRGRPGRRATEENGYISRNAHEIEIELTGGVTLDGELIDAPAEGAIRLRADRSLTFIKA